MINQHVIKIECENQHVKLIFTSLKSLIKFIHFYQFLNGKIGFFINEHFKEMNLSYYLGNKKIGESNPSLPKSWVGKYLGRERSAFYPTQFFSYFFSPSN